MGVAACLLLVVTALLEVFLDLGISALLRRSTQSNSLTVEIRQSADEPAPERAPEKEIEEIRNREYFAEPPKAPTEPDDVVSPESQIDEPESTDWQNVITESVAATRKERTGQELIMSTMLQQSHSIMFEPKDPFVPRELDPAISNFQFKPEINVAGLGFTIGSCFIGIPLVGVPVEDRTAAISVFVCAKD